MAALLTAATEGLRMFEPPAPLTLSQWSDEYLYLSPESSAMPGKFQTSNAEYQRGIMDAITDPRYQRIVLMMGSQLGKTQIQLAVIGYFSHWDPAPILVIQASVDEAENFSKNRVAKMIRDTPALASIFPSPRSRDSGNTLDNKEFPGGVLVMRGANAPAGLASRPIRILLPDEVDRYPKSAGTEGDPVDLAEKRTSNFHNKKIVLASTPGIKNDSRIEEGYRESDQRRYFVPCPHCDEAQVLEWRRLKYEYEEGDEREEDGTRKYRLKEWYYVCVNGCVIEERSKFFMIAKGECGEQPARPMDERVVGFHLNALYSPFVEWRDLIYEWLKSSHNIERQKTFINTRLAETWEIRGEKADKAGIEARREHYGDKLPAGVLMLTCGADVQKDRIEASVVGWGLDSEVWLIEHRKFYGDPSLPVEHEASPWRGLDEFLRTRYPHILGPTFHIAVTLVDSGNGNHTKRVYEFTSARESRGIHACKGVSGFGRPLISGVDRKGVNKALLFSVAVDTAKDLIYSSLRIEQPGPGFVHFPLTEKFDSEYFRQLAAEEKVSEPRGGKLVSVYVVKYERNEALDCFNYAAAARDVANPNFGAIRANLIRRTEEMKAPQEESESEKPAAEPARPLAPVKKTQSIASAFSNGWAGSWRR